MELQDASNHSAGMVKTVMRRDQVNTSAAAMSSNQKVQLRLDVASNDQES